jgi:hypothetical protein
VSELNPILGSGAGQPAAELSPAQKVQARMVELGANISRCPVCQTDAGFTISDKVVHLILADFGVPPSLMPAKGFQPCVSMLCNKCGYTMLVNLFVLGLGELTGLIRETP